jgi:hypothetical protein
MQAHDNILAARVKQTRDANKRRRMRPFVTGDLCYVSTKNISFPKGYARKLVPKYIGPYKILEDFGNYSYRIELPTHLKQRGVHDVYHASLLRIHIPNDDRLFPGRLDTQLGNQDTPDGKWAIERIEGHVGARTDAIFKMRWKSGDVTWMPYYQIEHLDVLGAYLELLGIEKIYELPRITPSLSEAVTGANGPNNLNGPPPPLPSADSNFASTSSLTLNSISFATMPIDRSALTHLNLMRLPDGSFTLANPDNASHSISATAQDIGSYTDFDRKIRDGNLMAPEPAGYDTFAQFFNSPAGSCLIKFGTINRKTMECVTAGEAPTYRSFQIDKPNSQRSARMSTGGRIPRNTSAPTPTAAANHTPSVEFHSDGRTTYSSQEQATITRLSLHAATQFLKGKDAAEARRTKRDSPYPIEPSPIRPNDKRKQARASKRAATTRREADAMEIDNEGLISDTESPEVLAAIKAVSTSKGASKATKVAAAKEKASAPAAVAGAN